MTKSSFKSNKIVFHNTRFTKMQKSLIMADFYTKGDAHSKKRLVKEQENLMKADVMLVKQNNMLPTILPGPEDKLFPKNYSPKEKYNVKTRKSKSSKEPEIFNSPGELNRMIKSLSLEATVTKSKNLIEEKKSVPSRFQKYTTLENFLSQLAFQKRRKLKSACPSFMSSTHNLGGEKLISEYNYSQKSLPPKKKVDLGLQIKLQNSLDLVQKRVSNKMQNAYSTNTEDRGQQTSKCKLKNEKSIISKPANDTNILNIYTLSNDHKSNSSHSSHENDSVEEEKDSIRKIYSTFDNNGDNQKSKKDSNLININCTTAHTLKSDKNKLDCQIKYSWQDIDNWLTPSQKNEIIFTKESSHDCKITYSWQVLGIGTQTSHHFLQNFDKNDDNDQYQCTIKYSWQIVGKSAQASLNDYEDQLNINEDYWQGIILPPRKKYDTWNKIQLPRESYNSQNKTRILYCERTQTLSDKRTQTDLTDCRVKYSWENLITQHLESLKSSKFEASEKILYDKYCVEYLKTRMKPIKCSAKYSWENLINQRLNS